jgi:lysophospholipase L1-like esterase
VFHWLLSAAAGNYKTGYTINNSKRKASIIRKWAAKKVSRTIPYYRIFRRGNLVLIIFVAIFLLIAAEVIVRITGADVVIVPDAEPYDTFYKHDRNLGWTMKPNLKCYSYKGKIHATFSTNSQGLRSREISPKGGDEYRILSLGESTTAGLAVGNHETYSYLLEKQLARKLPGKQVVVVNAGGICYSSYQSLKYLELIGVNLKPNLVLIYHELNDYTPALVRIHYYNIFGIGKTDKQLYGAWDRDFSIFLMKHSSLLRFTNKIRVLIKAREIFTNKYVNVFSEIGIFDLSSVEDSFGYNPYEYGTETLVSTKRLTQRVSNFERMENFKRFKKICDKHGISLIVIHPAYKKTLQHECLLTDLCKKENILMFDAFESLHGLQGRRENIFYDASHPMREGHAAIARDLAEFIQNNILIYNAQAEKQVSRAGP